MIKKTYFLDDNNNIVDQDKATHFMVEDFDEKGELIEETFGMINASSQAKDKNVFEGEVTPEMQEVLDNYKDRNGNYMFRK